MMKQRIVAAIPNYNMGMYAAKLAQVLLKQHYDHVYVLDDASRDDSVELLSTLKSNKRFTLVAGKQNEDAGPNRNRILQYETDGIVHFLDADVEPTGIDTPEQIIAAFARHPDAAVVGLRVKNPDGGQYEWNFGPITKFPKDSFTYRSWHLHQRLQNKQARALLKRLYSKRWNSFWTFMHPADAEWEQQVGAVVECNMAVRIKDFAEAGGFSPHLRFHEIHHLALNLRKRGKTIWYIPTATVIKYDHGDVRINRRKEIARSQARIVRDKLLGKYR